MKAVRDPGFFLTGSDTARQYEVLRSLAQGELVSDLPTATSEAIVTGALDQTATPAVRQLAYQVVTSGAMAGSSEQFLDQLVNMVVADCSGEDKELGMAAMTALFSMVKETQLLPLFNNPAFTDMVKAGLTHDSTFSRQSMLEILGRALPRLLINLEKPNTTSGSFPSTVDALRYRQHVRDFVMDLVKKFLESCEDGDDCVSAAAYLALDNLLDLGNPPLMTSQVADFLETSEQDAERRLSTPPELTIAIHNLCLARLVRLLLRYQRLKKGFRISAMGVISRLVFFALLDTTNMFGLPVKPPQDSTMVQPLPSSAVCWATAYKQIGDEWLLKHLVPLLHSTELEEAYASATWVVELLHLPGFRWRRKNLAQEVLETLLRLPTMSQFRNLRPFLHRINDAQAVVVLHAIAALKWLSICFYESVIPRLLKVIRAIEHDACRVGCIGEVVALVLCDVQRNGRMADTWLVHNLLSDDWVAVAMMEDGGPDQRFREEFLTAVIFSLLKLAPIVFLPIGLQVKLGNLVEEKIPQDLNHYARIASVTRITRRVSQVLAKSLSSVVTDEGDPLPFWAENCGRWVHTTIFCLQRLSFCANWPSTAMHSTFSVYVTLLSITCSVLLTPMKERLSLPPEEVEELKERLKSVLLDLIEFKLPEGVSNRAQRLKVLRILSHHSSSMGSDADIREQTALDIIHFLNKELTDQDSHNEYQKSLCLKNDGQLGGAVITAAPRSAESWWRARVALRCMQQVALNVKPVAPVVINILNTALEKLPEAEGSELLFKEDLTLTIRRIERCLPEEHMPSPSPPKPTQPAPVPTTATPFDLFPTDSKKLLGAGNNPDSNLVVPPTTAEVERVLLIEPLLLPNMEPDGRIVFSGDATHEYWMTVYTALTKRLDRLMKNITGITGQGEQRASASNLFKKMKAPKTVAVTGGSDPLYATVQHSINPLANQVTLNVRAFNNTNVKLERFQLQLVIKDRMQAQVARGYRQVVEFCPTSGCLEPGSSFDIVYRVDILKFGDLQISFNIIFPSMEMESEEVNLDAEYKEGASEVLDDTLRSGGDDNDNGGLSGGDGKGQSHVVTLPSQPMTIPFIYFLRPPPEFELMLPSFQDIWNALPFAAHRALESDPSAVQAVQNWMAFSQAQDTSTSSSSTTTVAPLATWDIIRLMDSAPLYTNELLVLDRHILSLRQRARVTNRVRSVPYVSGRFFSEAWLFRTWSDDIVAAVLSGMAVGQGVWRARLELRCNNGQIFSKYIKTEEASKHFTTFLTNGIFHQHCEPHGDIFSSSYGEEGQWGLGSTQFLLTKWQVVQSTRKMLGLSNDPLGSATVPGRGE